MNKAILEFIKNKLSELNINPDILTKYDEPHRFYHTYEHIEDLITNAKNQDILTDELFLAIIFHDIIYDPKELDNEEKSAEFFYNYIKNVDIKQAILDTRTHKPTNKISQHLCRLDLDILNSDYVKYIDYDDKIFKEFQFMDYNTYKEKRLKTLKRLQVKTENKYYTEYRKPNIALMTGSYNPFHKGHYNILQKAEKIFDKVIVAKGVNSDKNTEIFDFPEQLKYRQLTSYSGLLTDFIDTLKYDVTIIKGLRNSTDLQYELTQYRYLQELKPNIKVISIFCDKEFEHISSSSIRILKKFNKEKPYLL